MKLQFTNGYRPHFDQISRIQNYLLSADEDKRIPRSDIVNSLGIPNKQVENLTSMMTGFGLVLPRITKLTQFGKSVSRSDSYFERLETLWIIHFTVSSNPEWVVWQRIINSVMPSQDQFEVDQISKKYFDDLSIHFSARSIEKKLPKEVGAVLAAYTRSELSRLEILSEKETGKYQKTTPVDVPPLAFLYCILLFRERFSPGSSALSVQNLCYAENSPGRVCFLDEFQVRRLLESLHDAGQIRLEQFANLDQVRLANELTLDTVLERIYGGIE